MPWLRIGEVIALLRIQDFALWTGITHQTEREERRGGLEKLQNKELYYFNIIKYFM